jgi:hypothetical protein
MNVTFKRFNEMNLDIYALTQFFVILSLALLMALECKVGLRCLVNLNISVFCEFCQRHDNFDEMRYFILAVCTIFRREACHSGSQCLSLFST